MTGDPSGVLSQVAGHKIRISALFLHLTRSKVTNNPYVRLCSKYAVLELTPFIPSVHMWASQFLLLKSTTFIILLPPCFGEVMMLNGWAAASFLPLCHTAQVLCDMITVSDILARPFTTFCQWHLVLCRWVVPSWLILRSHKCTKV